MMVKLATPNFRIGGSRFTLWILRFLILGFGCLLVILDAGTVTRHVTVSGPFGGAEGPMRMFTIPLRTGPLLGPHSDLAYPNDSSLRLWVNGREYTQPHAPHDDIRSGKPGAFSHWGKNVFFSIPKGSPNGPETQVELVYPIQFASPWLGYALLVLLSAVWIAVERARFRRLFAWLAETRRELDIYRATDVRRPCLRWKALTKTVGASLFCIFFALALRLRQRDLEFLIQPDFNWYLVESWRSFLSTLDPSRLPPPYPYVYLDGQFIVYAIADATLREIVSKVGFLRPIFVNDISFALGAALVTNIIAYAAACVTFFAACYQLTGRLIIAIIAAGCFFLTPEMLAIDIGRADFLNVLPLMGVFYCSCMLALGREREVHAVILGIALAFLATIKINGPFFGVFPALAAVATFKPRRIVLIRLTWFIALSMLSFAFMLVVLMWRYLYFLSLTGLVENYISSIGLQAQWSWLLTNSPFYYNIEVLQGSGWPFIGLYVCSFAWVLRVAIYRTEPAAIFLSLCLIVLSLTGMLAPKYPRGGYHMLPVFFSLIAFAVTEFIEFQNRFARFGAVSIAALGFVATLIASIASYQMVIADRIEERIEVQDLKRTPRNWLRAHVPADTTICVEVDSTWSLPPLDDFKVVYGPLDLPYLDRNALAHFEPPSIVGLKHVCPVIVTSGFHRALFNMELGQIAPATQAKWQSFFKELDDRYPTKVFSTPEPIDVGRQDESPVPIKRVYINDLRGGQS
jgi:hypothetical protein